MGAVGGGFGSNLRVSSVWRGLVAVGFCDGGFCCFSD